MMKLIYFAGLVLCSLPTTAQNWFTKTGTIGFYSHTVLEDIKASNTEVVSLLDAGTGDLKFQLLIKAFRFPKAAMQEHFNGPDYMNSNLWPKASFSGRLMQPAAIKYDKDGQYPAEVEGELTMHGVTRKLRIKGTITIKQGVPSAQASFPIRRQDFGISVPAFAAAKIADEIAVTVQCTYEPFKK